MPPRSSSQLRHSELYKSDFLRAITTPPPRLQEVMTPYQNRTNHDVRNSWSYFIRMAGAAGRRHAGCSPWAGLNGNHLEALTANAGSDRAHVGPISSKHRQRLPAADHVVYDGQTRAAPRWALKTATLDDHDLQVEY